MPRDEILSVARQRMKMALAAYSDSREDELDDLRFYAGNSDNQFQWPADVMKTRTHQINARPCLTINKLPQHVHQVTNDQRMNRPAIKVIPADDKADIEVAEVYNGIIRHIEYISDADVAYDTACENQVAYGEGYIRLLTEYISPDSFEQDIKIARVRSSFSVYMDPMIQEPTGADAKWCFITEDMLKKDYEREYPDAAPVSTLMSLGIGDQSVSQWISEDTIRIAEYFYCEHDQSRLNEYPGGQTTFTHTPEDRANRLMFGEPRRSRLVDRKVVKWCKINGYEILEEREWMGSAIPVIRVIGNEFEIEGQIYISGLVRNAKDAQRMYNYFVSQEAEMLALAPKAPFIGYGGQFEGYEAQWKTANTSNWPYLEVNPDVTDGAGAPLPLPARAQPPMASTGLLQAKAGAAEDVKSATGQYNASLGMTSNERSGKAILARQKEGDVGTYHYQDNLARAIRHVGRQLVDMIPKIYDTERIARIVAEDGEPSTARINPQQAEPVRRIPLEGGGVEKIFNPAVGKYDVRVITGPGFATKRQEALESMANLLQGNPQLWAVAGDLFVKNMDWPGAQELAKRFKKTIDPKVLADEDDPALAAAQQQIEQMAQEMEQMHAMLKHVSQSMEAQELRNAHYEADIKAFDAETKRFAALEGGVATSPYLEEVVRQYVKQILANPIEAEDPGMPPLPAPPGPPNGGMAPQ